MGDTLTYEVMVTVDAAFSGSLDNTATLVPQSGVADLDANSSGSVSVNAFPQVPSLDEIGLAMLLALLALAGSWLVSRRAG